MRLARTLQSKVVCVLYHHQFGLAKTCAHFAYLVMLVQVPWFPPICKIEIKYRQLQYHYIIIILYFCKEIAGKIANVFKAYVKC